MLRAGQSHLVWYYVSAETQCIICSELFVDADTAPSTLREITRILKFCVCDGALASDSGNILLKTHLNGCERIESFDTQMQQMLMQMS